MFVNYHRNRTFYPMEVKIALSPFDYALACLGAALLGMTLESAIATSTPKPTEK